MELEYENTKKQHGHSPKSPDRGDEDIVIDEDLSGAQQIKKLREKLSQCTTQKQEYLDGWQRSRADFLNATREGEKQYTQALQVARVELTEGLLPILESFEMAFNDKSWQNMNETWRRGMEGIYSQCFDFLRERGIEVIDPTGEHFNPSFHESVESVPVTDKKQDGVVTKVLQRGFKLGDHVIRPARVAVGHAA